MVKIKCECGRTLAYEIEPIEKGKISLRCPRCKKVNIIENTKK